MLTHFFLGGGGGGKQRTWWEMWKWRVYAGIKGPSVSEWILDREVLVGVTVSRGHDALFSRITVVHSLQSAYR